MGDLKTGSGEVISAQHILTSDGKFPARAKAATASIIAAAGDLALRLAALLAAYGTRPAISSGYRTPEANKAAGGAPKSSHLEGKAVDFVDPKHLFADWCLKNLDQLAKLGLWIEDPAYTKNWLHVQSRPVPGKVVFKP